MGSVPLQSGRGWCLGRWGWERFLTLGRWLGGRRAGCFTLAATGSSGVGCITGRAWAGRQRGRVFLVVVDALHVVKQVVPPGKAVSWDPALAARVVAQVGTVAVSMHPVGFPLMAE